MPIFIKESL